MGLRAWMGLGVCAAALVLGGCGGGGGSADPATSSGDSTSGSSTGGTATVSAPAITTQPASASVVAGTAVTFSVVASGTGLSYQWLKDGITIASATGASHSIGATTTADAGSYTVTVSNSAGSVTSSAAVLTVSAASSGSDSGTGSSTTTTTTAETWNIGTGANAADLHEALSFRRIAIALDTLAVSSSDSALAITGSGSTRTVTLDGATVVTLTEDSLGLTINASLPAGTLPEFALSGSYARTVTVLSSGAYKLSLEGVAIASANGPALNLQSKQRAFVVLAAGSSNTLGDTSTYSARTLADGTAMDLKAAFFGEGPIVLSGSGGLAVTSAAKHALASDAHVRLRSGQLTLAATKKDGLRANNAVVIDGGTLAITTPAGKGLKVEGQEDSVQPLGFIAINGGTLTITSHDKAVTASWESAEDGSTTTLADDPDPRVTINGGTITIVTTGTPYEDTNTADGDSSLSPEGIEAKSVLTINGGTIDVRSTDDALNAGTAIVINGGRIYAAASANDAIDSNGTLSITGGVVVAYGANGAEGGLDCDSNTFTITGGTFIGAGGRNSTPTRSVTTQNTVILKSLQAQSYTLRDASGQAAFSFTLPKASTSVLVGAPAITTGTTYSLVAGGTLASQGENFNGLILTPGTHSGGTVQSSFTVSSTVSQP